MVKGINRATYSNKSAVNENIANRQICVFISHQQKDKAEAKTISEYIQTAEIDVYFDEDDNDLRLYRQQNNPKGVVDSIKTGINKSTHMLCLLSPNSLDSKWVPFEIGYGNDKTHLSILTLKNIEDSQIPDYVKVGEALLRGTKSLNEYIASLSNNSVSLLETKSLLKSNNTVGHVLDSVLNWKL